MFILYTIHKSSHHWPPRSPPPQSLWSCELLGQSRCRLRAEQFVKINCPSSTKQYNTKVVETCLIEETPLLVKFGLWGHRDFDNRASCLWHLACLAWSKIRELSKDGEFIFYDIYGQISKRTCKDQTLFKYAVHFQGLYDTFTLII